jgi:hypothetical protein
MGFARPRRLALLLSLGLVAVLAIALPASASAARILYASGHELDPARVANFSGSTLVDPQDGALPEEGFDGCSDSEWATALARTDYDVLLVGEDAAECDPALSQSTLVAIGNYVRGGKPIIFTASHGDENDFLNAVFAFNTTNTGEDDTEALTAAIQPGATNTPFAGGVSTLHAEDLSEFLGSTPGTTIYSSSDGVWVFATAFGNGSVTYLGWDFCCGSNDAFIDDWYRVLGSATHVSNSFTIDGVTRNKKKGTATITATLPFAGDLTGSGNGVKAASAAGAVISKSVGAGTAQLVIKAKGKKRKKLNQKGKVKLSVAVTYTATGGSAKTQTVKVKLKKKHKK